MWGLMGRCGYTSVSIVPRRQWKGINPHLILLLGAYITPHPTKPPFRGALSQSVTSPATETHSESSSAHGRWSSVSESFSLAFSMATLSWCSLQNIVQSAVGLNLTAYSLPSLDGLSSLTYTLRTDWSSPKSIKMFIVEPHFRQLELDCNVEFDCGIPPQVRFPLIWSHFKMSQFFLQNNLGIV